MKRKSIGNEAVGYLFIAPFYLFFFFLMLMPIFTSLLNSFTNYDLYHTSQFIGLRNYSFLIRDPLFIKSLQNTARYAIFYIFLSMSLGFLIALILSNETGRYKFLRTCFYLPYVISTVCASTIWLWIFDPAAGILNFVFTLLGLDAQKWLHDPRLAMGCVIAVSVWKNLGYCMLINLAGIKNIPSYLYESAMIDGANYVHRLLYITIPMLQPTTFLLFVTSCINSFNVFEQVNVLTGGGPLNTTTTIVHQIYIRGFMEYKMGYAAAISIILFLIIFLITLSNFRFGNQGQGIDIG
jgi:multiple sugar transport system permease protein/raffinose/stachyose/melibiose transport system permease protein